MSMSLGDINLHSVKALKFVASPCRRIVREPGFASIKSSRIISKSESSKSQSRATVSLILFEIAQISRIVRLNFMKYLQHSIAAVQS